MTKPIITSVTIVVIDDQIIVSAEAEIGVFIPWRIWKGSIGKGETDLDIYYLLFVRAYYI